MNETQLGNSLRALPRVKASPAFTSKVVCAARARDERRPVPFAWRFAAAFAIVVLVAGVVQFAVMQQARRQRMDALRVERQQLAAELEAMKEMAGNAEPVVVLENDRGGRVTMDLDSAMQPAAYRTFD